MKGIRATKPRVEVAQKILHTIVELTENRPDFSINCAFEYIPQAKACSVPDDATPCTRLPYNNILCTIRWPENTAENLKFAKDAARELVNMVLEANVELTTAENTVYGNYGVLVLWLRNRRSLIRWPDPELSVGNNESEQDHKPNWVSGQHNPKLQALKKKYDPEMHFSKWFAITPA
jgi:hypothetical protein